MLNPVSNKVSFPDTERETLAFWEKIDAFKKSLELRRGGPEFVFYDGPPFATGLPHYGHLLAGTIKDIVPRYQTMRGNFVDRRFGWDCHGLPVEFEMEQELKISGKRDIEKLGVDVFNEKCRGIVLRYTREWRQVVTRMGRWVDFDNDYKTMDLPFMESIWWVFSELWRKGLVYEGNKILPYCPRCATPLSNFETNQGYDDVQDPAITVRFKIRGNAAAPDANTYVLAWTTTPWTLPSNLALAVGPKIRYVKIKDGEDTYILAKDRLPAYYKKPESYQLLEEVDGSALVGLTYEPLFPYFASLASQNAFRVLSAEFVSTEDGTGVVHIAPGFGEDDNALGKAAGLPVVCPIDDEGRFTSEVPDYIGREVKEADDDIMKRLKAEKKLVHRGTINHSYPHCWRCDAPLIYRAVSTWFVKVEQLRERLLAANAKTRWMPEHLRDGRFGKWLEGARDWAISRNRYWGTPIPVWKSEDGKDMLCIGSVEELEKLSGKKVTDLHKHFVDPVAIVKDGKTYRRVPQVLDCWFESGSMPYAQLHYPFENKERFESHFPANFIAEGLDQTRGWFYTLMVLSTALKDCPAFQNVVVNGMVLAEDGRKMSKRLKNYPDPMYIVDTYGADALRLCLMNSPVVRAEDLRFSEEGVKQSMRHLLIPWWNAYVFFVTYARIDGWKPLGGSGAPPSPGSSGVASGSLLDRWILSAVERLNDEVVTAMDRYDLQQAVRPLVHFIDELTNWYIRRSRRRFWKSSNDADKQQAYATLYATLLRLSKIAAPFVPFISEAIYRNLRTDDMPESVHLCDYPLAQESVRDFDLEAQVDEVIAVIELGRQLRTAHDLKVRQPLRSLHIVCRDAVRLARIKALDVVVMDELNVKQVKYSDREGEMATLTAKANFSRLGRKLGPLMKKTGDAIRQLSSEQLEALAIRGSLELNVEGQVVSIVPDDVIIERVPKPDLAVASAGHVVVALDTVLDEGLVREGLARELVNKIQNLRKSEDLDIADRIHLTFSAGAPIQEAVKTHEDYVRTETLAVSVTPVAAPGEGGENVDLNGHPCWIGIARV